MLKAVFLITMLIASAASARAETAEDNYRFHCAQCHGLAGRADGPNATPTQGASPTDHGSSSVMGGLTDDDIINAITGGGPATGRSALMPAYGDTLSKEEIAALKDYLRKLCKCKGR